MTPHPLKALLAGIVDYAGLFPPAALAMADAVRNYASYVCGEDSWALGRFIVPVARLDEFEQEAQPFLSGAPVWKMSALGGPNMQFESRRITDFNGRYRGKALIDTIEVKAMSVHDVRATAEAVPKSFQLFIEIPLGDDPGDLIQAIAGAGVRAKARTGGITADAFPSGANLARFIHACVSANVPFKATAGLHHPIRAAYNLTYQQNSEKSMMYGYLNVFLAAAFVKQGMGLVETVELLEEESRQAFRVDDERISWRNHQVDAKALQEMRQSTAISFGSCSFREPMDDLKTMKLL